MPDGGTASAQRMYMAASHRAVAGTLLHGLRDPGAVIALTGDSGLGKSLLLRHVLDEMGGIGGGPGGSTGGDVGGPVVTVRGNVGTVPSAWESLRSGAALQGFGLLVVEDAHEMSEAQLLGAAALLARSPPAQRPSLVFVAQPRFWQALSAPGLNGLREAIGTRAVLFPMAYADAEQYLAHLFRRAGASPQAVLRGSSLHALLMRAQGSPHRINVELGRVLPAASPNIYLAAPRPRRRGKMAAGLLAAGTLAIAALAALDTSELPGSAWRAPRPDATPPPVTGFASPPASDPEPTGLAADQPLPEPDRSPPAQLVPDVPVPGSGSGSASGVTVQPVVAAQPASQDGMAATLIRRGDEMLALKDFAAARLFYERAARSGSAAAALLLGGTYDPALVDRDRADPQTAAVWYGLAATLGSPDAAARLGRVAKPAPG